MRGADIFQCCSYIPFSGPNSGFHTFLEDYGHITEVQTPDVGSIGSCHLQHVVKTVIK